MFHKVCDISIILVFVFRQFEHPVENSCQQDEELPRFCNIAHLKDTQNTKCTCNKVTPLEFSFLIYSFTFAFSYWIFQNKYIHIIYIFYTLFLEQYNAGNWKSG